MMSWKGNQRFPAKVLPKHWLGLRKNSKTPVGKVECPKRDSNWTHLEYKHTGLLLYQPARYNKDEIEY
jgi:hypothetical protein